MERLRRADCSDENMMKPHDATPDRERLFLYIVFEQFPTTRRGARGRSQMHVRRIAAETQDGLQSCRKLAPSFGAARLTCCKLPSGRHRRRVFTARPAVFLSLESTIYTYGHASRLPGTSFHTMFIPSTARSRHLIRRLLAPCALFSVSHTCGNLVSV